MCGQKIAGFEISKARRKKVPSSNSVASVPYLVGDAEYFYGTIITVNFNTANQSLTNLLKNITLVPLYNIDATMYNFIGTSNTLTRDLEWAILQANCYCGDNGAINIHYDQANSRYSRYAKCMPVSEWFGAYPNDTIGMCASDSLQVIPAFFLTKQSEIFVQEYWIGFYPLYFGLHQNNQSQWSFYNYDDSEFPISSYTNWAPGYPNGTGRCAILDTTNNVTSVWKNYGCNTEESGLDRALCQGKACDASSVACCENCISNGVSYGKKQKVRTKHRHIRRMKMVNGKPVRIA